MRIFRHELKQGGKGTLIWTAAIGFMMLLCVMLYPEMKNQMGDLSEMLAGMGNFTQAFGMDKINFGTAMGFYGVECGNILGLGGGLFAAFLGISALAKEEKNRTAEFLLTHPVSRIRLVAEKLLAVIAQLVIMNVLVTGIAILAFFAIDETLDFPNFLLLHGVFLALQIEIAAICFGISAFLRRSSIGIGLGFAAVLYFVNIISNISEQADVLKYFTPFAYAEPSDILSTGKADGTLLLLGTIASLAGIVTAFVKYNKKDIV